MRRDSETACTLRHCLEAKHSGVVARADKAEAEAAGLQQANVDVNMQMIKVQAEIAQLREDNQCEPILVRGHVIACALPSAQQEQGSRRLQRVEGRAGADTSKCAIEY